MCSIGNLLATAATLIGLGSSTSAASSSLALPLKIANECSQYSSGTPSLCVIFNATAAREFPQAIFDGVNAKIAHQTTFQQLSPNGLVRWWPRTIKLVDFVKAASPTYRDTYLYAMRFVVAVISDKESLAVYGTSCQVVVVYKDKRYDDPTVFCEPISLDRAIGGS
jgi:hypothetical protein